MLQLTLLITTTLLLVLEAVLRYFCQNDSSTSVSFFYVLKNVTCCSNNWTFSSVLCAIVTKKIVFRLSQCIANGKYYMNWTILSIWLSVSWYSRLPNKSIYTNKSIGWKKSEFLIKSIWPNKSICWKTPSLPGMNFYVKFSVKNVVNLERICMELF